MPKFRNINRMPAGNNKFKTREFACSLYCGPCRAQTNYNRPCRNRVCVGLTRCWRHRARDDRIRIRRSKIPGAGKGVFAEIDRNDPDAIVFKSGAEIGRYYGEKITLAEATRRYGGGREPYVLQPTNNSQIIDAACRRGVWSMANGGANKDDSNARFSKRYCSDGGLKIFATKDIMGGEEIIVNYGQGYFNSEFGTNVSTTR